MKKILLSIMTISMISFYACDVDQTKKGSLPSVDVDVDVDTKAGKLPEFDIDWVDINIGTKTKTVTVPSVEIVMEEVEVEVPYLNAEWPSEFDDVAEQTISVQAEVTGNAYDLKIDEIYASGDRLIVISKLQKNDKVIGKKSMRVSDQIVINAPDLTVKHYIIGDKQKRSFNNNYTYISGKGKIAKKLKGAQKIYG